MPMTITDFSQKWQVLPRVSDWRGAVTGLGLWTAPICIVLTGGHDGGTETGVWHISSV